MGGNNISEQEEEGMGGRNVNIMKPTLRRFT